MHICCDIYLEYSPLKQYQDYQKYNQALCMWVGIIVTAHASQFQHSRSFPFFLINSIIITIIIIIIIIIIITIIIHFH